MPNLTKNFWKAYHGTYDSLMARKFGLTTDNSYELTPEEDKLIKEFFNCMELTSNDMTNTFRDLASVESVKDEEFLSKLMTHAASKEIKLKQTKSKWAGNE